LPVTHVPFAIQRRRNKLWARYFIGSSVWRHQLRSISRRAADEEDVALSAFDTFLVLT
jgi:hypothetical protein